ncbi:conserved hypothetical protein [Desulfamplus magnetovallimortis]|uniref:Uncharacterized protein n=1 Tax=Desulfamplus magnetovallimortis TaxID=1246637 RepID=A0A1W1HJS7_9BACT|nr:conserved hypothetical protein [Desulfamplus magnetovallimortis]
MSTTTNPVTQTAEVDVNSASIHDNIPVFTETGNLSRNIPKKMAAIKLDKTRAAG